MDSETKTPIVVYKVHLPRYVEVCLHLVVIYKENASFFVVFFGWNIFHSSSG